MADCTSGDGKPARTRGMCHACYMRFLQRQKAYGRFESLYVPAERTRQHVAALLDAGVSQTRIAELANVNRKQVSCLLSGRADRGQGPSKQVNRRTEERILAIAIPARIHLVAPGAGVVDATGSRRRLQALVASGWSATSLARMLEGRVSHCTVHDLTRGYRTDCLARTARSIEELFDRLQFTPGPSDSARARGRRNRWPLPFAWNEDEIDMRETRPVTGVKWKASSSRAERIQAVLEMTESGLSSEVIAERLGVSERTVVRDRRDLRQAVA